MVATARKMGSRQSASPRFMLTGRAGYVQQDFSLGVGNVAKPVRCPTAHRIPYLAVAAAKINQIEVAASQQEANQIEGQLP